MKKKTSELKIVFQVKGMTEKEHSKAMVEYLRSQSVLRCI